MCLVAFIRETPQSFHLTTKFGREKTTNIFNNFNNVFKNETLFNINWIWV